MKNIYYYITLIFIVLSQVTLADEPIDTQIASGGLNVHLLKTSVNHGVLTVTVMVENTSDELVIINAFDPEELYYVVGDKRYPVLRDAENNWMLSPFGIKKLFFKGSANRKIRFDSREKIVGWMKFEAPVNDAWPVELSLPQTAPFLIEMP